MRALKDVYPEEYWPVIERQEIKPAGFWLSLENRLQYIQELEHKLKITKLEDWYSVNISHIRNHFGGYAWLKLYD
jgi:hypothetical protein